MAEQIESMGAEFLMLDFEEDMSNDGGLKPASKEFIKKEMDLFKEQAKDVDIVITTALIPGNLLQIYGQNIVKLMKPGSIVVDLVREYDEIVNLQYLKK